MLLIVSGTTLTEVKQLRCIGMTFALSLAFDALSSQATPLAPGSRVRVVVRQPCIYVAGTCVEKVVGTLTSVDSLSIFMRDTNDSAQSFPRAPGTLLQVSEQGPCAIRARCIALGLVGGVGLGLLVGWINAKNTYCVGEDICGLVTKVAVVGGAGLGIIVGAALPAEHWQTVDVPARLSLGPVGRRLGLRLSLRL